MISPRLAVTATLAALASTVAADLQILAPGGPNLWWVADSINNIVWTCHENTQYSNFTVLVGNSNPSILVQPQPIISIQYNYDCSKTLTQQQEAYGAGDGYFIQFANPLNNTDVWAQSQPFEIKPVGSVYPATSATPTEGGSSATNSASGSGAGSPTGSGSGAAAQTTKPANGASGMSGSMASVAAAAAGVLGLMFA